MSLLPPYRMYADQIRSHCQRSIESYESYGEVIHGLGQTAVYLDRGAAILGVAHRDHVGDRIPRCRSRKRGRRIKSIALDDRLGCWVLLDLLPSMGIHTDILLTEDEECGWSSASLFDGAGRKYNWIYSFDRRGTDVVTYDLVSSDWESALEAHWTIGYGSYSDISSLEGLGVCGVNVGTGYHSEHTLSCHCDLADTLEQVQRFGKFYGTHCDTRYEIDTTLKRSRWPSQSILRGWESSYIDRYTSRTRLQRIWRLCPVCNRSVPQDEFYQGVCMDCLDPRGTTEDCEYCGSPVPSGELYLCEGYLMCEDCLQMQKRHRTEDWQYLSGLGGSCG